MGETLTCQWCGTEGAVDDFDLDTEHGDGFWCPDCDGHTFFDDEKDRSRRILLLLESKDGEQTMPPAQRSLKKRLSPLRYPGGKSKLADYIASCLHPEQTDTFVEVFAGGASVGLALLDAGLTKHLVLNDLDPAVCAFWKVVLSDPGCLYERLDREPPTKDEFYAAKRVLDCLDGLNSRVWQPGVHTSSYTPNIEETAWAELVVNRLSFSGITRSEVGPLGGKDGTRESMLVRWNPEELKKRIAGVYAMRDSIEVSGIDAVDLIETSAYWDPGSTLFIDPPYVAQGKSLYRAYYEREDHERLASILQSLYTGMPGADIIITYDDCPFIRELYPLAEVRCIGRRFTCNTKNRAKGEV